MPKSTLPYDDGYGDGCNDSKAEQFVENVIDLVTDNGPCVAERIECHHCGYVEVAVHPFAESMECSGCGKRNPSSVPIYPDLHRLDGPP